MTSRSPPNPASPTISISYSDDEDMKRNLLRKRRLEESEVYNAPETLAAKRRAVKVAAQTMPVPKEIPNLSFDDHIEPSESPDTLEHEQEEDEDNIVVRMAERGSNAAQSGVDGVQDAVMPDAKAQVTEGRGELDVKVELNDVKEAQVQVPQQGIINEAQVQVPVVVKREHIEPETDVRVVQTTEVKMANKKSRARAKRLTRNEMARAKKTTEIPVPKVKRQYPELPKVTIDPRRWAKKSDQAARRSRRRLRRLLREEQSLLSQQLQVA